MRLKKNVSETVSNRFALQPETISDAPLVQLRGTQSASVENHRGILVYTDHEIQIAVRCGCLCFKGEGLVIARMTRKLVEIRGRLRSVEMS